MKQHLVLFLYSCALTMLMPLLFSFWHLVYFAPFMILMFYRSPLKEALWWSLACGLIIDLFSSHVRLGTTALNYCATTYFLHNTRFHFFEDRQSTLPIMTLYYSAVSNALQGFLLTLTGEPFLFSWSWIKSDLIFIPLKTSLYALLFFNFPIAIFSHLRRLRRRKA